LVNKGFITQLKKAQFTSTTLRPQQTLQENYMLHQKLMVGDF
jgi:hypothetical protein